MEMNSASDGHDLSETPPQSIAVAYFNRIRPIPIDHYLHREGNGGFVPLAIAAALIAVALLLVLD
jgi:hypothetical protein